MKFQIKKEVFLKGLNNVSKALSTQNLIPILSGIKLNLTNEGLFLTASDNDIGIETFIPADKLEKIEETGKTVIQGRYLLEIIRKLESSVINITLLDDIKVLISCGKSEFNLNCMEYDEFPNLNMEEQKDPIVIKEEDFKDIINKVSFAVSTQETRPILTGINFKIKDDKLECVSTDSYRLAKKTLKIESNIKEEVNVAIPGKNLIELTKILENDKKNIETDRRLEYKAAQRSDIVFFKEHYSNLTDKEIDYIIEHKQLYFGLADGEIVGFVGMHVEKCVGILKVFEKYRHNGYGKALESFMIKECLERGLIAYTQVETDNKASIALQESIGLIRGSKLVYL